jgi:hypothetical protein
MPANPFLKTPRLTGSICSGARDELVVRHRKWDLSNINFNRRMFFNALIFYL